MKLQSMTIIFIIVILPITMLLSEYIQKQTDTLKNQISYDSKLYTATYDSIKAFQLNTINNTESAIANSKIRDIQAAVNTFFNSVSSNFRLNGYDKETIQQFVPALVFTMYDGYYIYSPYEKICNNKGEVELNSSSTTTYGLKPYVYYSCRYMKGDSDFVITYSLDNYIRIQGIIDVGGSKKYVNDAGYVIDCNNIDLTTNPMTYRGCEIDKETLSEYVYKTHGVQEYKYINYNGTKYYLEEKDDSSTSKDEKNTVFYILNGDRQYLYGKTTDASSSAKEFSDKINANENAKNYYVEAKKFTERLINDYKLDELEVQDAYVTNELGNSVPLSPGDDTKIFGEIANIDTNTIVEPDSNFNIHRLAVIRNSIETNLSTAIAGFNKYSGGSTNFQMPKLKETEWELLLNNICIMSFLQGLNIGGKEYNGYTIIPNSKTKEVVTEKSIYITASDGYYYQVSDSSLLDAGKTIGKGYFNLDFERASINYGDDVKYYIPRVQSGNVQLGSYTSIVGKSGISKRWKGNVYQYLYEITTDTSIEFAKREKAKSLAKEYYTALGRERYSMHRYK